MIRTRQCSVCALARLHAERLQDLVVVSGFNDPATAYAVSMAMDEIHALGAPPPFKIASVAYALPQYSAYHFAERYAQRFGIVAKVLASVHDAMDWLDQREDLQAVLRRSPTKVNRASY